MASIGLVHDNPTPTTADNDTKTFLEAAGHTVTFINETSSPPSAGTHDLIIISESGSASAVAPYDTYADPVMVWETAWADLRLSSAGASSGGSTTQVDLTGHVSTTGLPDPLTYISGSTSLYGVATSTLPSGVTAVAVHPSTSTHAFAIVADAGATLTSGTAPARRAAMGLISTRPSNLTADGQDLVLAIVDWLVGGAAPPNQGTVAGGYAFSGSGVGSRASSGTSAGSYSFAGSAAGERASGGSASGAYAWTGSATGSAPGVGPSEGSAAGGFDFSGTATGYIETRGSTSGSVNWAGSAAGSSPNSGSVAGSFSFSGTATGSVPLTSEGSASGGVSWVGTATGAAVHEGSASGTFLFAGSATGEETTYDYEPPTYERVYNPPMGRGPRFSLRTGISIVRIDGVLRPFKTPSPTMLREAGSEGEDWFIGGHIYRITAETRAELTTGGFL